MKILLVSGPNLNLLGEREPAIYGTTTLAEIEALVLGHAAIRGVLVEPFQSNHEGAIIDFLHARRNDAKGVVINPGALTHYSWALRDAFASIALPCVEVHLSDLSKREAWRQMSVLADLAVARVMGKGPAGYVEAVDVLLNRLGVLGPKS